MLHSNCINFYMSRMLNFLPTYLIASCSPSSPSSPSCEYIHVRKMDMLLPFASNIALPLLVACTSMHVCCKWRSLTPESASCRHHAVTSTTYSGLHSREPAAPLFGSFTICVSHLPHTLLSLTLQVSIHKGAVSGSFPGYGPGEAHLQTDRRFRVHASAMPTPAHSTRSYVC